MKNYLIIDNEPPASRALRLALMETQGGLRLNQTSDPAEIKQELATGQVTAVFVRIELWDYRLFEDLMTSMHMMPELVLLGRADQEPAGCCGIGIPEFLADDASAEDLKGVLKYINSSFIQVLDSRFILAGSGDKMYKVDISQIQKVEGLKNGSVVHTTCGRFVMEKSRKEMKELLGELMVLD